MNVEPSIISTSWAEAALGFMAYVNALAIATGVMAVGGGRLGLVVMGGLAAVTFALYRKWGRRVFALGVMVGFLMTSPLAVAILVLARSLGR